MTDKILQKYKRELVLSKTKKKLLFLIWLSLLILASYVFLFYVTIRGFLIFFLTAHLAWMKLVETNRKIKLLEMTIYIRKIELKELIANPNDPLFQEIKNIFTPKK